MLWSLFWGWTATMETCLCEPDCWHKKKLHIRVISRYILLSFFQKRRVIYVLLQLRSYSVLTMKRVSLCWKNYATTATNVKSLRKGLKLNLSSHFKHHHNCGIQEVQERPSEGPAEAVPSETGNWNRLAHKRSYLVVKTAQRIMGGELLDLDPVSAAEEGKVFQLRPTSASTSCLSPDHLGGDTASQEPRLPGWETAPSLKLEPLLYFLYLIYCHAQMLFYVDCVCVFTLWFIFYFCSLVVLLKYPEVLKASGDHQSCKWGFWVRWPERKIRIKYHHAQKTEWSVNQTLWCRPCPGMSSLPWI